MRLLLDTHVALWAVEQPGRLPRRIRALLADGDAALAAYSDSFVTF
jgi:PIN domain nuclease of toxin-antitoxin system